MNLEKELKKLENKKNSLEKKDVDLIIADFDDTIFSRNEQLASDENLIKYRGDEGTKYIKKIYGFEKFVNNYYKGKSFPKTIVSKLRLKHDLILTAGIEKFQKEKIKALKIDHINYKIVDKGSDKILETLKYTINTLGFIPNKITVYEDRPEFFIEYKNLIEEYLGTKLVIMLVEMKNNKNEPKITEIK